MARSKLSNYVMSFFLNAVIIVAVLLFTPGLPPSIRFESYKVTPPVKLEGKLSPNNILDSAELFIDREFVGPESIATRRDEVYTGVSGGKIIRIKKGKVETVAQIGAECQGYWEEGRPGRCGRPLGMRFDGNGKLVVADAYYGILRIDVDSGHIETLVSTKDLIDGKQPRLPDDLDIGKDGTIYWSDASTATDLSNSFVEYLGQPSGRIIKTDPKTKESVVLVEGFHFANGVQLSKNEEFLFICETLRSSVWKYYLKGGKKGEREVVLDGLPGMPDNIRANRRGGYFISLVIMRDVEHPMLTDTLSRMPLIRKLILRVQGLFQLFVSFLEKVVPDTALLGKARVYVNNLGPLGSFGSFPKTVIIVEIDENGNILRSLQTENSPMTTVTEVSVGDDYTYFGSFTEPKLWRIRNEDIFPNA